MRLVLVAPRAVLLPFRPLRVLAPVLGREVVPAFAHGAFHDDVFPRHCSALLQDLGDHAGAHRAAAFADREPQLLLHRNRRDQLDRHLRVVPLHHRLPTHPHPPPPPLLSRPNPPHPPSPPPLPLPPVDPPLPHRPPPLVRNPSPPGIRNGFSTSRFGTGMLLSSAANSSSTFPTHALSPAIAFSADPRITGTSSPGNSYFDNSSRTSTSTSSNSSASSTRSHLLRNTTT